MHNAITNTRTAKTLKVDYLWLVKTMTAQTAVAAACSLLVKALIA